MPGSDGGYRRGATEKGSDQARTGRWLLVGCQADGSETRIVYSMVDFDKSEQLLHVGIAHLQKK